jgi:hypothetical protein
MKTNKEMIETPEIFGLDLPEQVPIMGFDEPYIIGGGELMCGGESDGVWDYCTGYGYGEGANINFLKEEHLKVIVDGISFDLHGKMRRCRGTGVFCLTQEFPKAAVCLADFAPQGKAFAARLIALRNTSEHAITVRPYAELRAASFIKAGKTGKDISLASGNNRVTIAWGGCDTAGLEVFEGSTTRALLLGAAASLPPGQVKCFTLFHSACISEFPPEPAWKADEGVSLLNETVREWLDWSARGKALSVIGDKKGRDIADSVCVFMRMMQGKSGGMMDTPRAYTQSYTRDSLGMMGMVAVGHLAEVRKYLEFYLVIFKEYRDKGEFGVPNAVEMDSRRPFFGFGDSENWSCEVPGLLVLLARNYYRATSDAAFLRSIDELLRYCIDVQMIHAEKHGWRMFFSLDETESCGSGIYVKENSHHGPNRWSFYSSVLALASAAFFIEFLESQGRAGDAEAYRNKHDLLGAATEKVFWDEDEGIYNWFVSLEGEASKTRVPNYHIAPFLFEAGLDAEHTARTARNMLQYRNPVTGFIPAQFFSYNDDFCGHSLGYLLYAALLLGLPEAEKIYDCLLGTVSAYGMWCESHFGDGTPYTGLITWDGRFHNLRALESGMNIASIIKYWQTRNKAC